MRHGPAWPSVDAAMATRVSPPTKTIPLWLLNLGTFAVFALWLAVACYALAYLISR